MGTISEPAKKRLVLLAQLLLQQKNGRITSAAINRLTGWSDSLIRHDISSIGFKGGFSNGYNVSELREAVCNALHIGSADAGYKCCIVGLGRLGAALLDDSIFSGTEYEIVAGFDPNVNRTEILRSTFPLYPASRLESVIQAEHIVYAVLAVADKDAQLIADRLARCGIRGIVNYTNVVLSVSNSVALENVSPVTALTNLSARTGESKI
ncbi:MAG: CoA-binding protein [Treponema sp.]|nr:CoA-binding protein [Treponema sp.]